MRPAARPRRGAARSPPAERPRTTSSEHLEAHQAFDEEAANEPSSEAEGRELRDHEKDQSENVAAFGAQRHAHADLLHALRDVIGNDAVDADGGEGEAEARE